MPEKQGPNVRQRRVARHLRAWRLAHGDTQEQVADRLTWSDAKVSRLERAEQQAGPAEVIALATILRVDESERDKMASVAVAAAEHDGWWRSYGPEAVRGNFEDFIETEADASTVCNVENMVVPGLLQTAAYADAIMRAWLDEPDEKLTASRSQLRQQRQGRLDEDVPLTLHAVIHENVLRTPIGGPSTMSDQLLHLFERARQPNVTVQVIPADIGAYPGMGITYNLIYFDEGECPAVYLDNLTDGVYLENDADIAAYTLNFKQLGNAAKNPDDSAQLIQRIKEQWT